MYRSLVTIALALTATHTRAQIAPTELQTVGFNSSFTLSASQIEKANLSESIVANLNNVIRFDTSQLANGGPAEDDFYTLPPLTNTTGPIEAGTLLKVQSFTNTAPFTLPPNTALSRILYTTRDLNGTVLPASAFVLWPFKARQFPGCNQSTAPVVLWTHGTSGFFAPAAPSSHRALWYGDNAPFALALAGYAVVAPDYAGLGISKSWDGSHIPHQYLVSPASAYDALYSLRSAFEAFPGLLSEDFVVMGHSQGGGVAWGVAEALAAEADQFADLEKGYLGTIAGSPTTDLWSGLPELFVTWVSLRIDSIFPTFDISEWLTPLGIARTELLKEIEGSVSATQQLFLTGEGVLTETWNETWYVDAYAKLSNAGRKPFKGPLLVMQGTEDIYVPYDRTTSTVEDTCALGLESDLEYLVVNGTGHVPTLDATRQIWLGWIEDRFVGKSAVKGGCVRTNLESFLPIAQYQAVGNSVPQWAGAAEYSYETVLGP